MNLLDHLLGGARANKGKHGTGVAAFDLRQLAHEPWQVFSRVQTRHFNDQFAPSDLRKGFERRRTMVDGILGSRDRMRLNDDALPGMLLP